MAENHLSCLYLHRTTLFGPVRPARQANAARPVAEPDLSNHHPLWQRFRPVLWLGACFLVLSTLTRLALLLATVGSVPVPPLLGLRAFGVGLGYDLLTFVYF